MNPKTHSQKCGQGFFKFCFSLALPLKEAGPWAESPEGSILISVLTNMNYGKMLSEFELISLQKRKLKGEGGSSLLKAATRKKGNKLLFSSVVDRTRNNGLKLQQGRFRLERKWPWQ